MPKFCYSDNEELFRHECEAETREEVVVIAEEELGLVRGDAVWIGVQEEVHPESYIDADYILDDVAEAVSDIVGDAASGWPCESKEDREKLQAKLAAAFAEWMAETGNKPSFYAVVDVTRHVVGE